MERQRFQHLSAKMELGPAGISNFSPIGSCALSDLHLEEMKKNLAALRCLNGTMRPGPPRSRSNRQIFPETAEKPAICGLLRLRFSLRGDRFWPECDFRRSVSGPRNIVSPMQIRRW